ncbi:hypothetical protein BGZ60DRAFT_535617 [Tricladium varicosporioides]|nr:hypothetical protein BGZ60DRAFT_535617 [Hymenoscyphus varicosporioides]
MTIAKLLETLQGRLVDIADYAFDHYRKPDKRPLRLAVNGDSWISTQCSPTFVRILRAKSGPHINPIESNILFFTCRILHLGIELYFVFDNPKYVHGRHEAHPDCCISSTLLREILTKAGVPWHEAPAEAEAECARMEMAKIVDGVWSEDGRALAFGCSKLIQSYREIKSAASQETKAKSHTKFRVYEVEDIIRRYPGMDQNGFILAELLGGNEAAHPPVLTPKQILSAAAPGFGSSLRTSIHSEKDFQKWTELNLPALLAITGVDSVDPPLLASLATLQACLDPIVSEGAVLTGLLWPEKPVIDEEKLFALVADKLQWTLSRWLTYIVPIGIVRALLATKEGQEDQHNHLQLETKKKRDQKALSKKVTVTYLISEATTVDITTLYRNRDEFETLRSVLRKSNFDGQKSIPATINRTPPTTGKKNGSSSTQRPVVVGIPLDFTSRGIPDTPQSLPRIENGEGPSNRSLRAESPPSPTPISRKRKLPWSSSAKASKKGKKTSQAAPTQIEQPKLSRKGKGKQVVHRQQTPEHSSPPPRSTDRVSDNDIFNDHDARPTMTAQRPSLRSPIRIIGHTSHDPIMIDEDPDDDNYGSFPSIADLPATPPEPPREEVENSPMDDDGGSSSTEYGSLPSSPDLRDFP